MTIHKRNPVILIGIQLFWNLSWRFPHRFKLFSGFGALFNRKLLDFKSDFCASFTSCIAKLLIINNILFLTASFCRNFTYVAASLMSVYITPFSIKIKFLWTCICVQSIAFLYKVTSLTSGLACIIQCFSSLSWIHWKLNMKFFKTKETFLSLSCKLTLRWKIASAFCSKTWFPELICRYLRVQFSWASASLIQASPLHTLALPQKKSCSRDWCFNKTKTKRQCSKCDTYTQSQHLILC